MTAPAASYGNPPGQGPLRLGGVAVSGLPQEEANLPSTQSASTKRQASALALVRDLVAGPETVRAKAGAYLPQAPGESPPNYAIRLQRSVFFNVLGKTIEGLTGFVFAKDPVLGDDVPAIIRTHWENIDLAGTHGDVFARDTFQDALAAGHAGVLVDYPATGGSQTAADEQRSQRNPTPIRPYWVPILKDNIVSWRTATVHGHLVLTQLVLREGTMVADGSFGEKEQTRYRVLYRDLVTGVVGFQLLEITEARVVTEVASGFYPTQDEIPFAEIITSGRVSFLESKPPLLDLAYLNVAHYQTWSDRATSAHKTCVPIWVETGVDVDPDGTPAPLVLGPNSARRFTNPAAKAGYEAHDGAAIGEVTKIIEEIKSDMAVLGLAMLAPQKRAAETAEAKRIDKQATDSQLGVTARGAQDGYERALGFHARYLNLTSGGSITINRDFERPIMDAATMVAYATLAEKMGLPIRVILEQLQRGGRIAENANLDELEQEMIAAKAAADEQARLDAAAEADRLAKAKAA